MLVSSFGSVVGDGVADDTAALQAILDGAVGKRVIFDVAATYKIGRLLPRSNTLIVMSSSVHFKKALNAGGTWYLQGISNTKIYAYGATIDGTDFPGTTVAASTVYANGTVNCEIHDLVVDGSSPNGAGKDCLYIGLGTDNAPNQNLKIIGGSYNNAKRNGISIVGAHDTLIEGVTTNYAVGAPGFGIDIEANTYGAVLRTTIRDCTADYNENAGIFTSFGEATVIDNCDAHHNGTYGFGASSGAGQMFAEGVYRPNVDVVAIMGFNTANGEVTVSAQPPVGTPVVIELRNGATRPPEFSGAYFIISRHVGVDRVIIGKSVGHSEYVAFSSAGSGSLTGDPATSDIRLLCFVSGQSNDCVVKNSRTSYSGQHGIIASALNGFLAFNNDVSNSGLANVIITAARDVSLDDIRITGGSGPGIYAAIGSGTISIANCSTTGTAGRGVALAEWSDAVVDGNTVTNCAASEPSSAKAGMHFSQCLRPVVTDNRVTQDVGNTTTIYGIYAEGSVSGGTVSNNDCTGAGTSNANSIFVPTPANTVTNNIQRDGVLRP